jgi:osmotically inducible protein OsmC
MSIALTKVAYVTSASAKGGRAGGGFGLAVAITVDIPDADPAVAQQAIELAHQFCPYSKATRGNIDVTVSLA